MKYFRAVITLSDKSVYKSMYDRDQKKAESAGTHYQDVKKAQGFKIKDHWIESADFNY